MGSILNTIKNKSASPCIKFLKDCLTIEKIEILKSINEDFLISEETFCSFFLTDENYFNYFDSNRTGIISLLEIFTMIYLFKNDSFKIKLSNLLNVFIISTPDDDYYNNINDYNNRQMNKNEFKMAIDTFISTIVKIFDLERAGEEILGEKTNYVKSIYCLAEGEFIEEIKLKDLKEYLKIYNIYVIRLLEKDDNLFQIFNIVFKMSAEVLES